MRLQQQMLGRHITFEWRLCDPSFEPTSHDRWLVGDNACYNVPPVNSIYKGQEAQMLLTQERPDVTKYLNRSSAISTNGGAKNARAR